MIPQTRVTASSGPALLSNGGLCMGPSPSSHEALPGLDRSGWGILGVPSDPPLARLLHSAETPYGALRHVLYQRSAYVPAHAQDVPSLVYQIGGPRIEQDERAQISERRLIFNPAGFSHPLVYLAAAHVLAVELTHAAIRWPDSSATLPATLYDDVWRLKIGLAQEDDPLIIGQTVLRFISRAFLYLSNQPPDWIKDVIESLHRNWQQVPCTASIAGNLSMSPQHLCRSFRRHMGVTIQQYGAALRVDRARSLLWGTRAPISQIALETGFADQSHLTRTLVEHSGRSPRKFRLLAHCLGAGNDLIDSLL